LSSKPVIVTGHFREKRLTRRWPSRSWPYGVNLQGANLEGANLEGTNLKRAKNLLFNQLSKVKTLYSTILDEKLLISLKEKYPTLFEKPDKWPRITK